MASAGDHLAFNLEIVKKAAANWNKLRNKRETKIKAIAAKRYDEGETKDRLAKRMNRVLVKLKRAVPPAAREAWRSCPAPVCRRTHACVHPEFRCSRAPTLPRDPEKMARLLARLRRRLERLSAAAPEVEDTARNRCAARGRSP